MEPNSRIFYPQKRKGKRDKGRPRTGHEGTEGGVDVSLYSFFNLGAKWGGWSTPRPGRFTPRKRKLLSVMQEGAWDPGKFWTGAENLASSPGFDPRTVQPAASGSRYDCAIPAHTLEPII